MALARSASGPGGLSINTGTANSLFASNNASQTPATGPMFGSASTGGLFGSSTTASAPQSQGLLSAPQTTQPSGGLFGSNPNVGSAPQTGGGLFGSVTATPQPATGSGLFSDLNKPPQPQTGGGLFSNVNNTSQPQQTGSLFGGLGSQPAQNQATDRGGLFGSTSGTQPTQIGGLFGPNTTSQPAQTGGMFGSNITSQPAQTGSFFSGLNQTQNKPTGSLFGGLSAPQQPQQQQQQPQQQQQTGGFFSSLNKPAQPVSSNPFGNTIGGGLRLGQPQGQPVPGVRIDISQIKGTTRFNDLHEDLQKQIENIDKIIIAQQALSADCEAIMPSHATQLSSIPTDVEFLSKKLIGVESSLESDAEAVALVGNLVKSDAEHARLSFKAIDNLKLPPQYHNQGSWIAKSGRSTQGNDSANPQDLVSFFSQTADEMSSTLQKYQNHTSEIEQHLRTVEAATMMQAQQLNGHGLGDDVGEQKRELAAVLREFEAGIRGVAGVVAETREGVQRLQLGGFTDATDRRMNGNGKRTGIY